MNKKQFSDAISEVSGLTKKDAGKFLEAFTQVVTDELSQGGKISIVGFGNFETRERTARKGRNPSTGAEIDIPASINPAFKPGKLLKESVNA